MVTIGLITSNKEDALRLSKVLEENHYTVQHIPSNPKTTHLSLMKTKPDIIIVELPRKPFQNLDIIQDIHYNKMLSHIPVIGFGEHNDQRMVKKFTAVGVTKYLLQPLRIKLLLHILETLSTAKYKSASQNKKKTEYTSKEEVEMLMDGSVMAGLKIEHMVKKVDKLLSFPFTISKFVEVTATPDYSAEDLVKVIKLDPGLSATILKAANSVEYGSYHRVSDFKEAIMRIGFEVTKDIVLSVKVMSAIPDQNSHLEFDREAYWYHSICNALIAEKIAKKINFPKPSYAFLAGLLHDYPTLIYDEYFGGAFDTMLNKSHTSFMSLDQASKELMGFFPCEFIVDLAQKWGLPNEVVNALRYYKSFIHLPSKLTKLEEKQLITIIGISDILAKVTRFGKSGDEFIHPISEESLKVLKFNAGIPSSFLDSIPMQVEQFSRLLGMTRRNYPEPCFAKPDEEPLKTIVLQHHRSYFEPHIYFIEHSDMNTQYLQSIDALQIELDSDFPPDIVILNEIPGTEEGFIESCIELLDLYPPNIILFKEDPSSLAIEESDQIRVLTKNLDIRQVIQAIDSFTIDLEDITR